MKIVKNILVIFTLIFITSCSEGIDDRENQKIVFEEDLIEREDNRKYLQNSVNPYTGESFDWEGEAITEYVDGREVRQDHFGIAPMLTVFDGEYMYIISPNYDFRTCTRISSWWATNGIDVDNEICAKRFPNLKAKENPFIKNPNQ
tara:strand:+ start:279 stop:716 length:438 start_codon:yes stop_codon:yes gene_type:complete